MSLTALFRQGACVGLLVALATALRLNGLGRWSLWLDEVLQYRSSATPLNQFHLALLSQDMPLSFLLAHAFISAGFDDNEWQLRLPFAILGVATVPLVYLLARELFGRRAAFFAGLVACVMPVLVIYSQEYRAYGLLVFLTTLCAWALAVALRTNAVGWWALFVGAAILSLYTHFVAIFFVAGLGVFAVGCVLLRMRDGEQVGPVVWSIIFAFAIIGIAFIPALPMVARLVSFEGRFEEEAVPLAKRLRFLGNLVLTYPSFEGAARYVIASLAGLGVLWAAFRSPRTLLFFLGAFAVPALLYAFYGFERASSSSRYTISLMIPYAVAVGVGLAAISTQIEATAARIWPNSQRSGSFVTIALALVVGILSASSLSHLYANNPKQRPNDLREGFDYVRSRIQPTDLLLQATTIKGGNAYWFKSFNAYYLRGFSPPPTVTTIEAEQFPKVFTKYLDRTGRLWVLITLSDKQAAAVQERAGADFGVQCFRRICAIHWTGEERPILEQVAAFFDKFSDVDSKYFEVPAQAVRARLDQDRATP